MIATGKGDRHGGIRAVVMLVVLAAAVTVTYGNTLANGYVWDDFDIVVDNPETHDPANLGKVLLSPDLKPPYYRPLPRALFLLEYAAFGPEPATAHAISAAFHLAAVLLLFALARGLFRRDMPALAVALLWAVHPLGSEAVGFVSVRTTPMVAAFALASLAALQRGLAGGGRAWPWVSGAAFLLALGCKEQAAMVLPLAALLAWMAPGPRAGTEPRRWGMLAPHAVALAAYLAARVAALGGLLGEVPPSVSRDAGQDPIALALAAGKAVALVFWPAGLTIDHDLAAEPAAPLWIALAAAAALTAIALWRRTPARMMGIAWFWLMLLPTLQVVALPSAPFAERHAYLLAPGLLLVLVDLAAAGLARLPGRTGLLAGTVATSLAAGALATRTMARNADWRDNETLFRSALAVRPSALALLNLGNLEQRRGNLKAAERHWRAAVAVDPDDADAWNQLGAAAARDQRFDEARRHFLKALEVFPDHAAAARNLKILKQQVPKFRDAGEGPMRHPAVPGMGHPAAPSPAQPSTGEAGDR